ncbi:hypothetical protein MRX96_038662 [Rhipicephalus microplus]
MAYSPVKVMRYKQSWHTVVVLTGGNRVVNIVSGSAAIECISDPKQPAENVGSKNFSGLQEAGTLTMHARRAVKS